MVKKQKKNAVIRQYRDLEIPSTGNVTVKAGEYLRITFVKDQIFCCNEKFEKYFDPSINKGLHLEGAVEIALAKPIAKRKDIVFHSVDTDENCRPHSANAQDHVIIIES